MAKKKVDDPEVNNGEIAETPAPKGPRVKRFSNLDIYEIISGLEADLQKERNLRSGEEHAAAVPGAVVVGKVANSRQLDHILVVMKGLKRYCETGLKVLNRA